MHNMHTEAAARANRRNRRGTKNKGCVPNFHYVTNDNILAHNIKMVGAGAVIGPASGACFAGSTLIKTPDGFRLLQDINVGDEVITVNIADWTTERAIVTRKYGAEIQTYYSIDLGKEFLSCTENHGLWVIQRGWVPAKDLQVGDILYSIFGLIEVRGINIVDNKTPISVYNIEVNNNENYLVGNSGCLVLDRWTTEKSDCSID